MAQRITNAILLEHIQAMKNDLQTQIGSIKIDVTHLQLDLSSLRLDLSNLRGEVHEGFEEARQHRQALQEDLNATIRLQGKHSSAIARLSKKR